MDKQNSRKMAKWQQLVILALILVLSSSTVMVASLRTSYNLLTSQSVDRIAIADIETISKIELAKYQFAEINVEQQAMVDQALSFFDEYLNAYNNDTCFDDLFETFARCLYRVSLYTSEHFGEPNNSLIRGTITVGVSAGVQKTVVSALVGTYVAAWVSYCVGMIALALAPSYLIPIIGQILFGAGVWLAAALAGYLYEKYANDLGIGLTYTDWTCDVASGWFIPNWRLVI